MHKLLLSEILHSLCNLQTHADQPLCCVRYLHKHKLVQNNAFQTDIEALTLCVATYPHSRNGLKADK